MAVPCHIPTNSAGGLPFLHTLSSIYCCEFFDAGHPGRCEVTPHGGFDLHFSLMSDVEYPFILAVSGSSSGKCPFRYFPYEIQGTFAPLSWYFQLSSLPLQTSFGVSLDCGQSSAALRGIGVGSPETGLPSSAHLPHPAPAFSLSLIRACHLLCLRDWYIQLCAAFLSEHSCSPGFPVHLSPPHLWLNHNVVVL